MATRTIKKNLAGEEDILWGEGTIIQTRNDNAYNITKVRTVRPVNSIAELNALDTDLFVKAALFDSGQVTFYNYSISSGLWEVQLVEDALEDVKNFATLALAIADTGLAEGVVLITGDRGGATWDTVLSSAVTENTFNIVQCTGVGTLSLVLRVGQNVDAKQFGAIGDWNGVTGTDDTAAIKAARDFISTDFNTSAKGRRLYFPQGRYKISSVIEIPPAIVLEGEARHNGTNLNTGSIIDVTHDGTGIRFVRKAGAGTTLTHNGGMKDLIVSGNGSSATVAQRLVELGDSGNVDVNNGAWGGFITRCAFNSTYGYGIYSAHSQEWEISGNYFKGVRYGVYYPTVAASAKITGNSFEMSASSLAAYAIVCLRGALGGAVGVVIADNYLISPKVGIFLSNQLGAIVRNNVIEGAENQGIYCTKYLIDESTLDDAQTGGFNNGVVSATIDGNSIINWNSDGAGSNSAIQLSYSSKSYVGQNGYISPNGAAGPAIGVFEDGPDPTDLNVIVEPVIIGSNAGTVLPYASGNSILQKNTMLTRDGVKLIVDNYAGAGSLNASDRGKVRLNSNLDIVYFSGTANEIIPRYRGDQTTVGSAGAASALPATPTGYVEMEDPAGGGGTVVMPFYDKA